MGASAAADILFAGRDLDADRAFRLGLVSEMVAESELAEAAKPYLDAMFATPLALALTKDCFNVNLDAPSLEAALAR